LSWLTVDSDECQRCSEACFQTTPIHEPGGNCKTTCCGVRVGCGSVVVVFVSPFLCCLSKPGPNVGRSRFDRNSVGGDLRGSHHRGNTWYSLLTALAGFGTSSGLCTRDRRSECPSILTGWAFWRSTNGTNMRQGGHLCPPCAVIWVQVCRQRLCCHREGPAGVPGTLVSQTVNGADPPVVLAVSQGLKLRQCVV